VERDRERPSGQWQLEAMFNGLALVADESSADWRQKVKGSNRREVT